MKYYIFGLFFVFFIGLFSATYTIKHYSFPISLVTDTLSLHDTITVDSIHNNVVLPNEITMSLDSVTIDTISTVVNGKIMDSKYHIKFK